MEIQQSSYYDAILAMWKSTQRWMKRYRLLARIKESFTILLSDV